MKSATLPAVRVQAETRALAESLLSEGESLSMFIEDSLKKQIAFRQSERDFLARGMASAAKAKLLGGYISAEESLSRLRALQSAKLARA
jgi:hypothetical protein